MEEITTNKTKHIAQYNRKVIFNKMKSQLIKRKLNI